MVMAIRSQQMENEKGNPYLPTTVPPLVMESFQGINTYTTRAGVDDKQCWWIDGFMPINERFLRTLYGPRLALANDSGISFFGFANIGATPYCIIMHSDGSIHVFNTVTSVHTNIAPAGTIQNPSRTATSITQYGSKYVLIITKQTNGYFIWDGTTFYSPGQSFPGGGTVPLAINGTDIETYQGRVWIVSGASLTWSAPGSVVDFTTADGGGSITSTDSFLRVQYISLIQTNGFLYLIGDSSVSYISGVSTSGTPPVTVFTLLNADPEVGSPWASTVTTFGKSVIFANAFGAHINYGSAVTKISDPLNGVYNTVSNFAGLTPSSAKAIIFGIKVWMLLLPIIDPITGQQINKLLIWDGKKWFASNQGVNLTYIQYQEINSVLSAWGTDGTNLYQLFQTPSSSFTKVVQSRLWDQPIGYQMIKTTNRFYALTQYYSWNSPQLSVVIDNELGSAPAVNITPNILIIVVNASGTVIPVVNGSGVAVGILSTSPVVGVIPATAIAQHGALLGMTISTQAQDMAIISAMIQPVIATGPG
jgi:hypothetical protein